jgi:multidrug transporter EmrE-like cation transporter
MVLIEAPEVGIVVVASLRLMRFALFEQCAAVAGLKAARARGRKGGCALLKTADIPVAELQPASAFAMKTLPVGTACGVWVGVGGYPVILGIVLLGEPVSAARMISVPLIVAGIVGLKLSTT